MVHSLPENAGWRVVLGLGTSIPGGEAVLESTMLRLAADPNLHLMGKSPIHPSLPMGHQTLQVFHNAACLIRTRLSAPALLSRVQAYERQGGRVRGKKNGPRPLDIDILYSPDLKLNKPDLVIPHPGLSGRWFAFLPAVEALRDAQEPVPAFLQRCLSQHLWNHNPFTGA
jgi:2-amino-4-hydroxy-6-hydroxymethyldihydropteridine diphosphokinase